MTEELTPQRKAAILRWLAGTARPDHALGDCAHHFGINYADLRNFVAMHGYPRPESMRRAAGILDGTGKPVQAVPDRPKSSGGGSQPDDVLAAARQSPKATTRALGERITKLLGDLTERLEKEHAAALERERVKAEREAAAAEVKRLREQLREAERTLRGNKSSGNTPGSDSKAIRAWAAENDIDCAHYGSVPASVRAAYDEAQKAAG